MSALGRSLVLLMVALPVAPDLADESRTLFNGKDLSGWVVEGPSQYKDPQGVLQPMWKVADGLLVCAGKSFGFLRYEKQQFADFALHVEYQLAAKGNSGIGIRTVPYDPKRTRATRPSFACYEVQLLDDAGTEPTKHSSGSLYRYVAPAANPVKPALEWNDVDIECRGPHIRIAINGHKVLDVDQNTLPELKNKPLLGFVCLQSHSNMVKFRNVRIREIKPPSSK